MGMLFLALVPWQMAVAVPAPPEGPTTSTGYDDGRRSSLLQLYDGLSIQELIQSSQVRGKKCLTQLPDKRFCKHCKSSREFL